MAGKEGKLQSERKKKNHLSKKKKRLIQVLSIHREEISRSLPRKPWTTYFHYIFSIMELLMYTCNRNTLRPWASHGTHSVLVLDPSKWELMKINVLIKIISIFFFSKLNLRVE